MMIEGQTRGDPETPLRWICKSTRAIARDLGRRHHPVSHMKVAQLLHELDYRLQGNRKTEAGTDHPDRDAQFRYINAAAKHFLAQGCPVISVDTRKKRWLAISRTRAGNCGPKAIPGRCGCTTSWTRNRGACHALRNL